MSYEEKYTSLAIIRGLEKMLVSVDDNDCLIGIEAAETYVERFLTLLQYDLDNLTTEQTKDAKDLASFRSIEFLAYRLPTTESYKGDVIERFRELAQQKEDQLRVYEKPSFKGLKGVIKEIAEEEETL